MKTNFDDCIELISNEDVRSIVKKALKSINERFFHAPASSSGKYHPPENCGDGGLIVHSRKVVQSAISLFRFFEVNNPDVQSAIIGACILHDICKSGENWESSHTIGDHGSVAKSWLSGMCSAGELKNPYVKLLLSLVENHMAIWNKPKGTPAIVPGRTVSNTQICHLIIQLSDYFSSRKWCPFSIENFMEA